MPLTPRDAPDHPTSFANGRYQVKRFLGEAVTHSEDALAFCRKAGYRPELAWTCCDYADLLRERDAEGDRSKTITLLDESLAILSLSRENVRVKCSAKMSAVFTWVLRM